MRKVVEAINGLCRRDQAIRVIQRDRHAVNGLIFVPVLDAILVEIQVDKVANRAQRLKVNGMAGLIITR